MFQRLILYFGNSAQPFVSLGKALESTAISMIREVVFGVGFALLLPLFFGLDGVLYSMPGSDLLTFLIAAVVIRRTYGELNGAIPSPRKMPAGA